MPPKKAPAKKPPASPPPSPESDPPQSEEASSPASSRASQSEGLIADPGPGFDPEQVGALPPPPLGEPEPPAVVEWEQDTIQALLTLKGRALHAGIGVAEEDWRYTELDLAAIAPPLTRICNRYEPIQRLAKYSDPATLALAMGAYMVRSLEERQAELRAREAEFEDTAPIEPAATGEPPVPPSTAPAPPPRQAATFPTEAPRSAPAPAPVDPAQVSWETPGQ